MALDEFLIRYKLKVSIEVHMQIAKRIFLFALVNILVITSASIVYGLLVSAGIIPPFGAGIAGLAAFSLVWGMAGSLISLMMSRQMAKWMMKVIGKRASQRPAPIGKLGSIKTVPV